jgi:hypothetical protein
MMMRLGGRVLLLVVLLCLPLGCAAPTREASTINVAAQRLIRDPGLTFAEILPKSWRHVDTYRININGTGKNAWIVLYRFDLLNEGGENIGPITAVVYQPDDEMPPNLVTHPLHPQDRDFLCECNCTPILENVLSGLDGEELVFYDKCGDQISRLTIFHWDENDAKYVATGHFCGTCIEVALDEVTVREPLQDRAQLSECKTYRAWDNRTYYQPSGTPVPSKKTEIVFSKGEPDAVLDSPYPEKIVLAFYQNYDKDEKASIYFAEKVRDYLGQCDTGECGCIAPRHEIDHVVVTELHPAPYSDKDPDPKQTTVGAWIECKRRSGESEGKKYINWLLVRENNRWQLNQPLQ